MMEAAFSGLLTQRAEIERPLVELDSEGGPQTPRYESLGMSVRVRIADARTASNRGLLGRREDTTHVIYSEMAELRNGDQLVTRPVQGELAEDLEAGATWLPMISTEGFLDGQRVELGGQEFTVLAVEQERLKVTPATGTAHEAGEQVRVIERYLAMVVEDAAGMGHHLRIEAKSLQGR